MSILVTGYCTKWPKERQLLFIITLLFPLTDQQITIAFLYLDNTSDSLFIHVPQWATAFKTVVLTVSPDGRTLPAELELQLKPFLHTNNPKFIPRIDALNSNRHRSVESISWYTWIACLVFPNGSSCGSQRSMISGSVLMD